MAGAWTDRLDRCRLHPGVAGARPTGLGSLWPLASITDATPLVIGHRYRDVRPEISDRAYGKAMQPIQGTVDYGISGSS